LCGSDNESYNPGIELNTVHLYQHYTGGPYCAGLWVIVDNINHHKQNNFKILNALFEVVCHDKKTWPGNYPVLQDTELGWIISDKIPLVAPEYALKQSYLICNNNLDQQLQRFWETEDKKFYEKNTSRSIPHKIYRMCHSET